MHCPNCGRKTSPELKFCRSCGMKLDSVARAVSNHLAPGEADESDAAVEEKSAGGPGNRFYSIYIGLALCFIGAALAVLGQGGLAKLGALIGVLGVFVMMIGALPAAARFDRALLRSMGSIGTGEPKTREKELAPDRPAELRSGDDFEPAASVTEVTTRNLDENKTKVVR